jgi:hypothetical protein
MNCLWFRLLVCMKCARHVENSSGSWQLKQEKQKIFWAGQSPFLLHGAFSLKVFTSEIRCSIHKCDEILSMQIVWMDAFFTLPLILIRNCIWSVYWCLCKAEVENLWSFSLTLYICMAWCLIKNEVT